MPNLKLTNLLSYKTYMQDLATRCKAIDGFKWGDVDVIRNDNRSDITRNFLWAVPYEKSQYGDKYSDNVFKTKPARLAFLIVPDSEKFSVEDEAFEYCESIMEDIMSHIIKDKRGEDVAGVWTMLATDLNRVSGGPVEHKIGSTKYLGWELRFEFMDNTNLAFDATKWD